MAARVREHATYEDLVRLPENVVGELIDGELYASPRPAGPHTIAASGLDYFLGPEQRTIEAYRRQGDSWLLLDTHGDEAIVRIEPFEAIEIDLTLLWGPLPT